MIEMVSLFLTHIKYHRPVWFGLGGMFVFMPVDTISDILKGDEVDALISLNYLDQ